MPRLHKEVPGPTLHKRPTMRGTIEIFFQLRTYSKHNLIMSDDSFQASIKLMRVLILNSTRSYQRTNSIQNLMLSKNSLQNLMLVEK